MFAAHLIVRMRHYKFQCLLMYRVCYENRKVLLLFMKDSITRAFLCASLYLCGSVRKLLQPLGNRVHKKLIKPLSDNKCVWLTLTNISAIEPRCPSTPSLDAISNNNKTNCFYSKFEYDYRPPNAYMKSYHQIIVDINFIPDIRWWPGHKNGKWIIRFTIAVIWERRSVHHAGSLSRDDSEADDWRKVWWMRILPVDYLLRHSVNTISGFFSLSFFFYSFVFFYFYLFFLLTSYSKQAFF